MHIWLIKVGEPLPFDRKIRRLRTALLAEKLIERGHSVTWWTSAWDHFNKKWLYNHDESITLDNGLKMTLLRGLGYKKNISPSRFIDHRIIARKFKAAAPLNMKPDVIVTSLPPHDLAYQSVIFANKYDIPVIVDIRDPWPDIFLRHIPRGLRNIAKLLFHNDFRMTAETMRRADGLIAVNKTFLEWGLSYAGRVRNQNDRVYHLGGENLKRHRENPSGRPGFIDPLSGKFVVTFIGTFSHYHNPAVLIDAAKLLQDNEKIHFVLAGNGLFHDEIKKRASTLSNVTLPGWLGHDDIIALLRSSHVGVCTTPQEIDLFPNKAFTYFSAGLPVLSSFQGELRDILDKHHVGCTFPPKDAQTLASQIVTLYNDPVRHQHMSRRALSLFSDLFDADNIYTAYAEHIEQLAGKHE